MYLTVAVEKQQNLTIEENAELNQNNKTRHNKNITTNIKGQPKRVVSFDKMSESEIDDFFLRGGKI